MVAIKLKRYLKEVFKSGSAKRKAGNVAKYWQEVLKRLISVIVFISERGLTFRGENQTFGSPSNGNYLGIMELIAEYDSFLSNHIKNNGNCGSGNQLLIIDDL